jgi:hypothetical protein
MGYFSQKISFLLELAQLDQSFGHFFITSYF